MKLTFRQFIEEYSNDEDHTSTNDYLNMLFEDFTKAWNEVIPYVNRFQCHDLPMKNQMSDDLPVVFGLVESKGESIYLCAILDYLVTLQNNFLQETVNIRPGTCRPLRFLEPLESDQSVPTESSHFIRAMRLEDVQPINIIDYQWNEEILTYSQRNLEIGHGTEIKYYLSEMEAELATLLVLDKVIIESITESIYLEPIVYHMETFRTSMALISEVKELLPQEPIPQDKLGMIKGISDFTGNSCDDTEDSLSLNNAQELLSALEILLCFLKRTEVANGEMLIIDYIEKWSLLSEIPSELRKILKVGLELKNIVALYELLEDKVADVVVRCLDDKYKTPIMAEFQTKICEIVEFDPQAKHSQLHDRKLLPADAFATALKRFMLRYLSDAEFLKPEERLIDYIAEESLSCWPSTVSEDMVNDLLPPMLLVGHAFATYQFLMENIMRRTIKRSAVGPNSMPIMYRRRGQRPSSMIDFGTM